MKKNFVLLILILVVWYPLETHAADESMEIQFPKPVDCVILYDKAATMVNGEWKLEEAYKASKVDLNEIENAQQLEKTAKKLLPYMDDEKRVSTEGKNSVGIQNLEAGVYLVAFEENSNSEMIPTLVSLPGEAEGEIIHYVTIIPKCSEKIATPKTGWASYEEEYMWLLLISFIIIMGLSCHNRFKCGRIPLNYSKIGGYKNGNDNDTKNPRCPRRIRQRGSRSVNRSKIRRSDGE